MEQFSHMGCSNTSKMFSYRNPILNAFIFILLIMSVDIVQCSTCDNSLSPDEKFKEPPIIHFVPFPTSSSTSASPLQLEMEEQSPSEIVESAENQNDTVPWPDLLFENCKVRVQFMCSAKYPIEWVENYDKDIEELTDTDDQIHKDMWTDRLTLNATVLNGLHDYSTALISINGSDTSYNAFLGLTYLSNTNGTFCYAANYSCRSVSNPCLHSGIISDVDPSNETIQYRFSNASTVNGDIAKDESCDAIITVSVKHGYPGWKCTGLNNKPRDLVPYTKSCDAAMHCNSYFLHYKKNCVNRLSLSEECLGCRYKNATKARFHPGYILCGNSEGTVFTALAYFYSVPQTLNNKAIPELYLDWNEADPQKMLYFEPLPNVVTYVSENLTLACKVSRYYFSFGHRFGFEYENGTIFYTSSIDGTLDNVLNVNRMTVTIPVDYALKRVYCFAPVWNSTKWVNQSMDVIVKVGSAPKVTMINDNTKTDETDAKNPQSMTFPLHKTNATLSCRGEGIPSPDITWTKDGLPLTHTQGSEIEVEPGRKDLVLSYVTYSSKGKYKCEASNFLGAASKVVNVGVRDEFALLVQFSGVGIMILVAGFIVILILCWKKIQRQRKQLRALTDSEIKEFRDGNLDILETSEFLDTQELIHALPYNDEFEIPCEKLYIDMTSILGTGNFGQVVKGTISERTNNRRKVTDVAVKTVKPNHDVAYFKTLLSEVKIMAYIGHHPNVVSLIGACTGNIRKREIFIAVEFCSKGCLEKYLKKCRSTFVNLVCHDAIHMTSSFIDRKPGTQPAGVEPDIITDLVTSNNSCITTVHLLKWSREIANGMEFLGSKKIIHGDLATRNVLLSEELVAKIGDFGLSRQLLEYKNYVRSTDDECLLPWKWMAPEILESQCFSVQTDVWSYGVTLWETFSLGMLPYPGVTWNFRFLDELKNGMRLHKPTYAHSQIYNVMLDCWSLDASQRPTFTELKDFFEGLLLQTCNDEYLETKCLQNGQHYVNGSYHVQVNNPGYSTLGFVDELSKPISLNSESTKEIDKAKITKFINGNRSKVTSVPVNGTEDGQGYLRPLMLESFETEEQT